jgi:ADP-ribose pyrophosphatase YjhB (NUDIX family)
MQGEGDMDSQNIKKRFNKKDLYCVNCGHEGHFIKNCNDPITSYGIIMICLEVPNEIVQLFIKKLSQEENKESIDSNDVFGISINDTQDLEIFCHFKNSIKFLLIQRKHTLGFIEFIRGRYNIENVDGIIFLFKQMTPFEIKKIKASTFDDLWDYVWGENKNKPTYQNEYVQSKIKFEKLNNDENGYLTLDFYIDNVTPNWDTPEWGFPKGRRNFKETDTNCALREFKEESNYKDHEFTLLNSILPIEERLIGTNGINYRHIYYVALAHSNKDPTLDNNNLNQKHEIGNIGLYTYEETIKLIRPYHIDRQKIMTQLYIYVINSIINIQKDLENIEKIVDL